MPHLHYKMYMLVSVGQFCWCHATLLQGDVSWLSSTPIEICNISRQYCKVTLPFGNLTNVMPSGKTCRMSHRAILQK